MNPQKLNFPEVFQTKCFSGSNFSYHYLILSQPIWPQLYRGLFAVHHKQRSNQIYSELVQENCCHHMQLMRNNLHID